MMVVYTPHSPLLYSKTGVYRGSNVYQSCIILAKIRNDQQFSSENFSFLPPLKFAIYCIDVLS